MRPNDPFVALEMVRKDNKRLGEMIVAISVSGGAMEVEIDSRKYVATSFQLSPWQLAEGDDPISFRFATFVPVFE